MLSKEELDAMVAEEEKRLGVGSKEFLQRHNEIMELIDRARGKGAAADGKADYECQGRYHCIFRGETLWNAHRAGKHCLP